MAYLTGANGKVESASGKLVINVKSWTLDIGRNFEDTTALGDSWDETSPTTGRCSGSIEVDYDPTDTDGQLAIQAVIISGANIADLKLFCSGAVGWHGPAKFTGSIKVAAKAMQTATLSFVGNGEWKYE